jgi:arylsulfatase A-like enzyme
MSQQPNIVVVLADDMGYGDARCYDPAYCKVPTPNIDLLARQGMMFTDAHTASSLCSPSRYGLLTGRYAWRTSLQHGVLRPYDPPLIAANRLTVPAFLKQHGYHTACIGKWHLGWDWPRRANEIVFDEPIAAGPTTRGFDWYFGTDVPNYPPFAFIENDHVQGTPTAYVERDPELVLNHPGPGLPGWRFDLILPTLAERVVTHIGDRAKSADPFFLYFPLTTPHEPIAPSSRFKGKSGISGVADLIMETDWALGEVMKALDQHGLTENTLLIFTTDNGHCPYTGLEPFQRAGHRVSGPFRGYKADIWEGGHRVPFIARWPRMIPPGTHCEQTICLTDLMATCTELLGAALPQDAAEDSVSVLPLLLGSEAPVRDRTVYHSGAGNFAVFQGPWKLALCPNGGGYWNPDQVSTSDKLTAQLYDLREDPGERQNLFDRYPDVVDALLEYIERVVSAGRSTSGPPQQNEVYVDIWKRQGEPGARADA